MLRKPLNYSLFYDQVNKFLHIMRKFLSHKTANSFHKYLNNLPHLENQDSKNIMRGELFYYFCNANSFLNMLNCTNERY